MTDQTTQQSDIEIDESLPVFSKVYLTTDNKFREGRRIYRLTRPMTYDSPTHGLITIPANYETDLASVPRVFQGLFPKDGRVFQASIVHDYLYDNAINTKDYADSVFREACEIAGVRPWRRWCLYFAVRYFGKGKYPVPEHGWIYHLLKMRALSLFSLFRKK